MPSMFEGMHRHSFSIEAEKVSWTVLVEAKLLESDWAVNWEFMMMDRVSGVSDQVVGRVLDLSIDSIMLGGLKTG
jgi:hypothetical protein